MGRDGCLQLAEGTDGNLNFLEKERKRQKGDGSRWRLRESDTEQKGSKNQKEEKGEGQKIKGWEAKQTQLMGGGGKLGLPG